MSRAGEGSSPEPRELAWTVGSFVATFACVTWVYGSGDVASSGRTWAAAFPDALMFAGALMTILLAHESGHYFVARMHGFLVSPPFFIPLPIGFGTMGAFIRLRSLPRSRQAQLEMGAAGPIAGAIVAFVLLAIFLPHFRPPIVVPEGATVQYLNDPLIAKLVGLALTGHVPALDANYHPVAFAAWVGCLLTGINLLPIGQLDGGHVANSLIAGGGRVVSRVVLVALVLASWVYAGWLVWALLLRMIGGTRSLALPEEELPVRARVVAGACALLFLLTFMPVPVFDAGLGDLVRSLLPLVGTADAG